MGNAGTITDAILTINGISLDLGQFGNIAPLGYSGWAVNTSLESFLQIETFYKQAPFPPGGFILPTSRYALTTTDFIDPDNPNRSGAFTLNDTNHPYSSEAFLNVYPHGTANRSGLDHGNRPFRL